MDSRRVRGCAVGGMLALGVFLWLTVGRGVAEWNEQLAAVAVPVAALVLVAIPSVRRVGQELLGRIEAPSARRRAWAGVAIALAAAGYLVLTAYLQGRYFGPVWHDEYSYLTQAQMLARGRLWMPPHELGDFLDSFCMIQRPVYASMYFPGTALMYVPTVWLGLPSWVMPVLAAGGVVGLVYRIASELVDAVTGALSALLLVCLQSFRMVSLLFMSQTPVMLLGLLMVWGYLRWRESRRGGWLAAIGVFAGWAAVTRPMDAVCFALPVGVAMLLDLRQGRREGRAKGSLVATVLLLVAGAAPFLALQAIVNRGVTGSWTSTPWGFYHGRDFPQVGMGFRGFDPKLRPGTASPHKQMFYDHHARAHLQEHNVAALPRVWWQRRLPTTLEATLPHSALMVLLPAGVLACGARRRWVLAAVLPGFMAVYVPFVFFTRHYPVIAAPAAGLLVALGVNVVADTFPRRRGVVRLFLVMAVAGVAVSMLPEARRRTRDEPFEPRLTRSLDRALQQVQAPAVVLVRFWPAADRLDEQSVSNASAAWPDDAGVIRAHDLGERNVELFRYYAQRQPARRVYRFEERDGSIEYLGVVTDLSR